MRFEIDVAPTLTGGDGAWSVLAAASGDEPWTGSAVTATRFAGSSLERVELGVPLAPGETQFYRMRFRRIQP